MSEVNKIKELEDKLSETEKTLNDKNVILEKTQNSKLKLFIFLLLFGPIFQFIPLRKGSLIENYGFPNGLLYFYIGCAVVIPIAYLLTINNMYREIDQIENDIEMLQKRIEILKKKKLIEKSNPPVFLLTIVAIIVGSALFKQIDFNTFTVEKKALSAIYFVTFAFSVYVLAKHYIGKSKK